MPKESRRKALISPLTDPPWARAYASTSALRPLGIRTRRSSYDKAISIYTELRDSAKVRYVRIVVADDTLRSGDYKQAAEMYEKLGEEQKAQDAWRSYGDLCISEKKYDEAIKIFENLKDYDRVLNSYCSWADDLMEQQRYQEAAEKYRLCNMETNAYATPDTLTNHRQFQLREYATHLDKRLTHGINLSLSAIHRDAVQNDQAKVFGFHRV